MTIGKKKKKKEEEEEEKKINNVLRHRKKKKHIYIYIAQTIKFATEKQRNWEGRKEKTELKGSFQFYL